MVQIYKFRVFFRPQNPCAGFTLNCIFGCFVANIYIFKFKMKCVTICLHNMNLPLFCCDMCIRNCCVAICVLCCIYKPKIMHTQVITNVSYDSHLFTVDSPLKIQCIQNHPLLDQSCRFTKGELSARS